MACMCDPSARETDDSWDLLESHTGLLRGSKQAILYNNNIIILPLFLSINIINYYIMI